MESIGRPMNFKEVAATAVARFRSHPLQTALTLAGLTVGTAAIIVIVTLGLSGRAFVMGQIEGVGSHLIWASYDGTVTSGVSRSLSDGITAGDVDAVSTRTDLFSGVTPLIELRGTVPVSARAAEIAVLGTTPNYGSVRKNLRILAGRFLDADDISRRARVCVVSRKLFEELYGRTSPDGKFLRTLGTTFEVIGEFDKPVDTMGQGEVKPESIFIPITVGWFFTPERRIDTLFAEVRDFSAIPGAVSFVSATLRERHHAGAVFNVDSMTTVVRVARAISSGLILAFVLAAAVSVVVGGVGIMNILLASVESRTREIGLRLSVGARRRDILRQFLLEALALGVAGASVGVVLGIGLPALIRPLLRTVEVKISGVSAVAAFMFSCVVTLLFGTVPAYRASALSPTEALRHE